METILKLLFQAQKKLSGTIPLEAINDMLLTLLFWKLLSEDWRRRRKSGARRDDTSVATNPGIHLDPTCTFESCQWQQSAEAHLALRSSLIRLADAQPDGMLKGVLRPDRFGMASPYIKAFKHSPSLAVVMNSINGISIEHDAPEKHISDIFGAAKAMLEVGSNTLPGYIAQLMVTLIAPQAGESICDLLSGDGQLLQACMREVMVTTPNHRLFLLGQEANANTLALAKMHLLTQGVRHRLEGGDTLNRPGLLDRTGRLLKADGVLVRIPHAPIDWNHIEAAEESLQRFPGPPPRDGRLALVWQALATMTPENGRACCLMPLVAVEGSKGMALRRYLVDNNLLDAVIELPLSLQGGTQAPQILLLISQKRLHETTAFISRHGHPDPAQAYDVYSIQLAFQAWRQRQQAPWLHMVTRAGMAMQRFQLAPQAYAGAPTRTKRPPARKAAPIT